MGRALLLVYYALQPGKEFRTALCFVNDGAVWISVQETLGIIWLIVSTTANQPVI